MLLEEFINPMGLTQKQLAEHLCWTTAKISEIVNGRRGLTAASALALADAFEMEPEFWLNLRHAAQRHVHLKKIAA